MTRLTLRTKLVFGSADLYGGGALNMIGFYYLIFLTDVVQISPAYAGVVLLASRVWDAVTDPAMGAVVDRTRTRIGRRRPYFFAAVVTVFISVSLVWYPVGWGDEMARFLFALFGYLFFSTVSTTAMIPYLSLQPHLTPDYDERTSLNVYKMGFSFVAGILAAIVPMEIVAAYPDIRVGYRVMGLCAGVFFALPWLGLALTIRERDNRGDPPPPRFSVRQFLEPLKIRTFRSLILMYLGAYLTLDVMSSVIAFAMSYLFGRPDQLNFVLGTLIICQLVFLPAVFHLTRRVGKNRALTVSASIWLAGVLLIAAAPANAPLWVLLLLAAVTGIGVGGSVVTPWTMYPDTTDVGFLVHGRDTAGAFSGTMMFVRKLASALALFIVGVSLEVAGFVAPIQESVAGVTSNVLVAQTPRVLVTIRLLLVVLPVGLLGMAGLVALRYPLSQPVQARLARYLRAVRGESAEPADEAEADALRRLLV